MSVDEEADIVEVLYDYSYEDESGVVTIKVGDKYTLLEKTNQEWWQVVGPQDADSFFVPAQYVRIITQEDDGVIYANRETLVRKDAGDSDDRATPPGRENRWGSQENDLTHPRDSEEGSRSDGSQVLGDDNGGPREEVFYANLDDYRVGAGLPRLEVSGTQQSQPSEYANISMGPEGDGAIPPSPAEGDNGRRLVEYLPWFIYREHGPGRPFYVNTDTGERTFKPPRHKNQRIAEKLSPTFPKMITEFPGDVSPREVTLQTEYEEVKEDGRLFYINKKTNDKYERIKKDGSLYFFHVKSGEAFWELPLQSPRFHNGDTVDENRNRHQTQSLRMSKAKSMCETLDYMKGDHSAIKAHTLPPSFSYGSKIGSTNDSDPPDKARSSSPTVNRVDVSPVRGESPRSESPVCRKNETSQSKARSASPTIRFDDELSGTLNKAKIADVGKKVKKNWSQSYVVIRGSNIVFYKDQKAALSRPGSPHGKPDLIISLLGAKVDFSQSSSFSSKKNVITLTANTNTQFLLQSDDESTARTWFFRLKVAADDIQEKTNREQKQAAEAHAILRSQSVDDAQGGAAAAGDRHASFNATYFRIRDKLLSLISRRPTQEDLVKRGIIKDSVFGANLQELCTREHNTVPNFVKKCIAAVEHKGLDHDGLYRISGNLAEIQKLRFMVDKEGSYNLDDEDIDVHVLTGSLKLFFRELKEPLFPFHLFERFTTAVKKEKNIHRLRAFKDLMADLPRVNHDTMKMLFHHLKKVIDNSHLNRMQTQNVAIVFGPTLMWSDHETGGMAVMTIMPSQVVEYILLEFDELFR